MRVRSLDPDDERAAPVSGKGYLYAGKCKRRVRPFLWFAGECVNVNRTFCFGV